MKTGIIRAFALTFLMALAISSCELLDCKTCEGVSITNGVETRTPGILTCGDELAEKENAYESYGNTISYYDCK